MRVGRVETEIEPVAMADTGRLRLGQNHLEIGTTGMDIDDREVAERLVGCAASIRNAESAFHFEPPSTRSLVSAGHLIAAGMHETDAAQACILAPLSSDGVISTGLIEVAAATLLPKPTTAPTGGRM